MISHTCDGCGKVLRKGDLRYTVKVDVRAAYDTLEIGLVDLVRDHETEIKALIEQLTTKDPSEVEESIYKFFNLDLCPSCQKSFILDPLRFSPGADAPPSEFDIDGLLRSLGYGGVAEEEEEG